MKMIVALLVMAFSFNSHSLTCNQALKGQSNTIVINEDKVSEIYDKISHAEFYSLFSDFLPVPQWLIEKFNNKYQSVQIVISVVSTRSENDGITKVLHIGLLNNTDNENGDPISRLHPISHPEFSGSLVPIRRVQEILKTTSQATGSSILGFPGHITRITPSDLNYDIYGDAIEVELRSFNKEDFIYFVASLTTYFRNRIEKLKNL